MNPHGRISRRIRQAARDDRGTVTVFLVVVATAVLMFTGLVLDGGLAIATKTKALGQAQEAARAGAQALDLAAYRADGTLRLVPSQAEQLADAYLASAGASGTVSATETTVTVAVTASQATQLLSLVGVDVITVTARANAQPIRGVTAEAREFANSEVPIGGN